MSKSRSQQGALIAYQWTVAAIVILAMTGAATVALLPDEDLDRLVNALQFIAVATGGLVGVASGFRPRSREDTEKGPELPPAPVKPDDPES